MTIIGEGCNQTLRACAAGMPGSVRVLFCLLLVISRFPARVQMQMESTPNSETDTDSILNENAYDFINEDFDMQTVSSVPHSSTFGYDSDNLKDEVIYNFKNHSIYPTIGAPLFRPVFTSISSEENHYHRFVLNTSLLARWPSIQLQFYAETEGKETSSPEDTLPLQVTAYWHRSVRSWDIPVYFVNSSHGNNKSNRFSDSITGKTLWTYPSRKGLNVSGNLSIEVRTSSSALIHYKIRVVQLKDFIVPVGRSMLGKATSTSPAYFMFGPPPSSWSYIFIRLMSDSDFCAELAIQQPRGPFLDPEDNLHDQIQYLETFTKKTGLSVQTREFPNGCIILVIPLENDLKCKRGGKGMHTSNTHHDTPNDPFRLKQVVFEVREGTTIVNIVGAMTTPIMIFFLCVIIVFSMLNFFHTYKRRLMEKSKGKVFIISRRPRNFQSNITMSGLIITEPSRVVGQTHRYCRAVLITSFFYCVPVFQLILTFRRQLADTGDYDICYFNHFCSHMMGSFHDFNHMYSNIWYILFGLLFMAAVRTRQLDMANDFNERDVQDPEATWEDKSHWPRQGRSSEKGVMTHYGLLYCMGYAIIMTGVMSGGYHICPNESNFQFDTVFMYTIAAITVVTLYQSRHPTYLSANFTFTALAFVTFITVLGLLWERFLIRVIFSVIHILFLLLSLPKVCYNGYIRKKNRLVSRWGEAMRILMIKLKDDWRNGRTWKIQRYVWLVPDERDVMIIPGPGRIILPGFLLVINCGAFALMWTILIDQNFATQVLFICVTNGSLYTIFYSFLKLYHGECRRILWIQPAFYLITSFALWAYAMHHFFDEVSSWEASPAESRLKNRECSLLAFYDSHDLWHFLSAAALFCSAMLLLTMDDDLVDQPKYTIPVF